MIEWLRHQASDEFGRTILTVSGALLAVAIGAFLGGFKDAIIESGKRKRLAWLTAMRLTVLLDKYVDDCAENVQDGGDYDQQGERQTRVPEPDLTYPDDLGWTSLHRELMYGAFRLKVAHDSADKALQFIGSEIAFPPDYEEYWDEKKVLFSHQGLAALEIIRSLTDHYGVPTADRRGYEPRDTFKRMLAEREREDAEKAARQREYERKRIERGEPPGLFPFG